MSREGKVKRKYVYGKQIKKNRKVKKQICVWENEGEWLKNKKEKKRDKEEW
jgi:hypothetical protein